VKRVHFIVIRLILASWASVLVAAQSNPMSVSSSPRTMSSARFASRQLKHASANSGSQTFGLTFAPVVDYGSGGGGPQSVAVADVNGDGKPDIVVANFCGIDTSCSAGYEAGTVGVLLANGDGTFRKAVTYGSGGDDASSVAIGDVNGDGKPDIVVANFCLNSSTCPGEGTVGVLLGNGDGTFQTAVTYDSGGLGAGGVAIADVNGDGKPDLLVINGSCNSTTTCSSIQFETDGAVGVLLNNGNGTFQTAVAYDSGGIVATSIAVGDLNGDGKPDLVVAQCSGVFTSYCLGFSEVGVMLGNGDGTFQAAVNYGEDPNSIGPDAVALADLNGDGDLDILVTNRATGDKAQNDGSLGVLLGDGDGTFKTAATYDAGNGFAYGLTIADLTGNGKLDAVVAETQNSVTGFGSHSVVVFPGNGDGTFESPVLYPAPATAFSVVAAALVGSGLPDLVVGTAAFPNSNSVGVLINTSGQGFSLAASPTSVTVTSGHTASYTLTVSPMNGFAQQVALSCSGAPAPATCTVNPSNVTLSGSGVTTAMITVATAGASASVLHPAGSPWANNRFAFWLAFSSLAGFVLFGRRQSCSCKRQGWLLHGLALTCVLSLAITCSGCGSGNSTGQGSKVAPGTYSLKVTGTATSGGVTVTQTANLTLVVQ
jgi:FG-GAP-like repeat